MSSLQDLLNPMSSGPSTPIHCDPPSPPHPQSQSTCDGEATEDERTEEEEQGMSIHNDDATEDSETESDRPPIGESAYSDRSSEVDGIVETDTSTTDCEAQRMRASPPAPPLPPPPPPPKTNITMAKPKKKKPPAPKKKGQAQSKKRHAHDDDDTEGPEDVIMVDAASPKKKSKKTHTSASKKKIHSKDGMTNSIGMPKYDKDGKELYCICRKPDTGKWMICCDGCEDWYHGECVKVKEEDGNLIDKYYCQHCHTPSQQTTWKRMCRLPHCRKPAAIDQNPPSKYCSTQCGVEYMNKYVIPRSTLSRPQVAALASVASTAQEFKRLGDHIPAPTPSQIAPTPEEAMRLSQILLERHALAKQKKRIEQRARYVQLAIQRRARVLEELQSDPEAGKVTTICGYDTRLALDDVEWDQWCESDEGVQIFETNRIPGKDGVCVKKNCRTHKGWSALFVEEQPYREGERMGRFVALRQEERKIRERQKRRMLMDGGEGQVEIDG